MSNRKKKLLILFVLYVIAVGAAIWMYELKAAIVVFLFLWAHTYEERIKKEFKKEQRQRIIDMMKADEESGIYNDKKEI